MGYYNKYDKRITTEDYADYTPGTGQPDVASRYCNEDGVEVSGIDFSAQYRSDMGLGVKLDYSYLHVGGRSVDSQFSQPRPHSALASRLRSSALFVLSHQCRSVR